MPSLADAMYPGGPKTSLGNAMAQARKLKPGSGINLDGKKNDYDDIIGDMKEFGSHPAHEGWTTIEKLKDGGFGIKLQQPKESEGVPVG